MKVRFSQVDEFCSELEKDAKSVDRKIVRYSNLFETSKLSPNIRHLTFVATYSVDGDIVELRRYCGDLWGVNQESDKAKYDRAEECSKKVEDTCKRLGLEVRAGMLEED